MRPPRPFRIRATVYLSVGLVGSIPLFSQSATAPAGPVTVLPKMTVVGESLVNYPLFPKTEVAAPDFSAHATPMDLTYPGPAIAAGVSEGNALVGVMLDERGHATDYLVIRYTQPYFGKALLEEAHRQSFAARRVKGVAVPARFLFSYRFVPPRGISLSGMDAATERINEIRGGPPFLYQPYREREIDGGGLTMTFSTVAYVPDGFTAPKDKPVRVLATFYVDEQGHVRLPTIESAPSAALIPNAIKAVSHWQFKPPTFKGKPVLVFALWTVGFMDYPSPTGPVHP